MFNCTVYISYVQRLIRKLYGEKVLKFVLDEIVVVLLSLVTHLTSGSHEYRENMYAHKFLYTFI